MACSICEATRLVYAQFRALGRPVSKTAANDIAKRAASLSTPAEAKSFIDAEIKRLSEPAHG